MACFPSGRGADFFNIEGSAGSPAEAAERPPLGVGAEVWVLKASINEWFPGKIIRVSRKGVQVEFVHGGIPCKKAVPWGSPHMRRRDEEPPPPPPSPPPRPPPGGTSEYVTVVGGSAGITSSRQQFERYTSTPWQACSAEFAVCGSRSISSSVSDIARRHDARALTSSCLPRLDDVDSTDARSTWWSARTADVLPVLASAGRPQENRGEYLSVTDASLDSLPGITDESEVNKSDSKESCSTRFSYASIDSTTRTQAVGCPRSVKEGRGDFTCATETSLGSLSAETEESEAKSCFQESNSKCFDNVDIDDTTCLHAVGCSPVVKAKSCFQESNSKCFDNVGIDDIACLDAVGCSPVVKVHSTSAGGYIEAVITDSDDKSLKVVFIRGGKGHMKTIPRCSIHLLGQADALQFSLN